MPDSAAPLEWVSVRNTKAVKKRAPERLAG